jgi:glycine cleavage system regulatory protein
MEEAHLVQEHICRYRLDYSEEVYVGDRSPRDDKQVVHRVYLVGNDRSGLVNEICLAHYGADLLQVVLVNVATLPYSPFEL